MSGENQKTICEWADKTFGPTGKGPAFRRYLDESMELMEARATREDTLPSEAADVLITLYRVAQAWGFDLHLEVEKKMMINRQRKWVSNGDGTGRHVK